MLSIKPTWVSFGATAAIVTSMGLALGLEAAGGSRETIIGALLIVALADNLTDSLSVHLYQEAEHLEGRQALVSTIANFATRLLCALSFVALVAVVPSDLRTTVLAGWGFLLLVLLTYWVARARHAPVAKEIGKHVVVCAIVLGISRWLGIWIAGRFG